MSQMERQMQRRDKEMVPKFLVQAMFALMIGSLGLVAYAQWADVPQVGVLEVSPVAESRSVTLVGDRTGKYVVRDEWGDEIASTADEKAGFIGVIGRVIDREREVFGVDTMGPITIARRENGTIAIIDPNTKMSIDLIGYGRDNVAAFENLLN
ncbi:MAG: photosynthetic complex assembly protein PuhC [Pseudomonadota bacterium]